MKTFSRARTAKAALVKILDMHEVDMTTVTIGTPEVETGRFGATATFTSGEAEQLLPLIADLVEAGFDYTADFLPTDEEPVHPGPTDEDVALFCEGVETVFEVELDLEDTQLDLEMAAILLAQGEEDQKILDAQIEREHQAESLAEQAKKASSGYIAETSTAVGPTKRVWAIADSMPNAARKDVIEACRAAGIAFGTARTQYQAWKKSRA